MRIRRLVIFAALLSASSSARALEPVTAEQAALQLRAQFSRMRQGLPKDDAVTRARVDAMEVETTRAFAESLRLFPDRRIYAVDVAYVAESFERLVLPRMTRMTEILTDPELTPEKRKAKLAELSRQDGRRTDAFNESFYRTNRASMEAAVRDRAPAALARWTGPGVTDNQRQNMGRSDFLLYSPLIGAAMDGATSAFLNPVQSSPAGGEDGSVSGSDPEERASGAGLLTGAGALLSPAKGAPKAVVAGELPKAPAQDEPRSWLPALAAIDAGAPKAYSHQSGAALRADRYADAARLARTALELDPKDKNALFVLASTKGRAGARDAAGVSRSTALGGLASMRPSRSDAGAIGAGAAAAPSRGAGAPAPSVAAPPAEAVLSPAVAPAATREALAQARTALRLGDGEAALSAIDKALARDPGSPALLGLRAQAYGRLGRWEEALKDADAALGLAPATMALLTTKALAENRLGRWREALATSERMIAADPRNPWGYAARAHARGGLGDKKAMLADIRLAASLDPAFAGAAAAAAELQLPADSDLLFLFPGENGYAAAAPAAANPAPRGFGAVMVAAVVAGVLLALGLLSFVLGPLKDAVVSAFTKAERRGPSTGAPPPDPAPAAPTGGGLIRGQYQVVIQIGQGGMGTVYQGIDRSLGRRVAIKKMRDELRLNERDRDRFVVEAKTVAALRHPNIVDIYAIVEDGDDVYLVFEFVEGTTVHDLVQSKGRLGALEAASVTRSMGEALAYAHSRGVIHRDMKPSNVMLTSAGQIKVMDFGIARMAKDALTRYSMTNTVVGTPPYMAPEQEQGVVRKESDVYALAVCSYEMLTGKMPFIGIGAGMLMNKINMSYIPPSRAIAGLPEALDEVFVKAFQADPDRRFRTPQEFVAALSAAADGTRSTRPM